MGHRHHTTDFQVLSRGLWSMPALRINGGSTSTGSFSFLFVKGGRMCGCTGGRLATGTNPGPETLGSENLRYEMAPDGKELGNWK